MENDEIKLPVRKKNQLDHWDYSSQGAYFLTVCVQHMSELLWDGKTKIIRSTDEPFLSKYGIVAENAIKDIPNHYDHVSVDCYCIMPNHIHTVIFKKSGDEKQMILAPTISTIIGQMKRYVSKEVGFPLWQKSFYDRIIRNQNEYEIISRYIYENPKKWALDKFNKNNINRYDIGL
ncbi:MAG: transposase [Eubacteriales bacterium]